MPLGLSSSLVVSPLTDHQFNINHSKQKSRDFYFSLRCNVHYSLCFGRKISGYGVKNNSQCGLRLIASVGNNSGCLDIGESTVDLGSEDLGKEEVDDESPWEGAIVYKRNAAITHVEYCTTLERLGLGKLSTRTSKERASVMGLRVTKAVKDYLDGTPVLVSIDVTRKKRKLRLDGVVRTVISLGCNRCGEPAAQNVFSNFSILLNEDPIAEEDTINMGTIFGEEKFMNFRTSEPEEEDDDDSIDLEDRLYFPPEEKVIDISKNIRDLVHIEITLNALCDPLCKGLCLRCGVNLNASSCDCDTQKTGVKGYGPLGDLKEQMHQHRQ
ncbi:hypothetical protein LIER_06848 [Lithospermum erythrorhizon]|uniref:Large ribosomal RNA subunit accumulation protein YCED homolog 1, chloroplastic n=1 Tax=Lithospermum erythrorhizon TaxID=34254 RepID=A0AAV3P8N1_LITER